MGTSQQEFEWVHDYLGNVSITRMIDAKTVYLQGDDAKAFDKEVEAIDDKLLGGAPWRRAINELCRGFEY